MSLMTTEKTGFNEVLELIFEKIREDIKSNLAAAEAGVLPDSSGIQEQLELVSGGFDVYEQLDGNGNYHFEGSKYGAGQSVNLTVTIFSPDDTFSAKLSSSGGGGGEWSNVSINRPQSASIKTNLFSTTNIKLDVHASNTRNAGFHARVEYKV